MTTSRGFVSYRNATAADAGKAGIGGSCMCQMQDLFPYAIGAALGARRVGVCRRRSVRLVARDSALGSEPDEQVRWVVKRLNEALLVPVLLVRTQVAPKDPHSAVLVPGLDGRAAAHADMVDTSY
jgi:hypothetical protein